MAKTQMDLLADYIMAEIPGEPSQSEGAGDTAIRVITTLRAQLARANKAAGRQSRRSLTKQN